MKLALNVYDHGVVVQVNFHKSSSIIEELLPFDCLKVNDFFYVLNHNKVTNGWNFIKLILNK